MHWINIVAYVGVFAMLAFLVLTIILHVLPTGHNALRNSVGDYVVGGSGALMTAALLALGIGALALSLGLASELGAHGGGKRVDVGVAFTVIFAIGMIVAAFVPPDAEGAERTPAGKAHTAAVAVAFLAFTLATVAISPVFKYVDSWKRVAPLFPRFELLVVVFAILMLFARVRALRAVYGLVERLFFASSLAWLLVAGLQLSQISR